MWEIAGAKALWQGGAWQERETERRQLYLTIWAKGEFGRR